MEVKIYRIYKDREAGEGGAGEEGAGEGGLVGAGTWASILWGLCLFVSQIHEIVWSNCETPQLTWTPEYIDSLGNITIAVKFLS